MLVESVMLPVVQPPIFGYQFFAFPLCIVLKDERSLPWLYSNFIQVCFDKRPNPPVPFTFYIHDYKLNPWLHVEHFERGTMSIVQRNIVDFVRDCLLYGYYVYLNVDEYYIPERKVYQKSNLSHDVLIHGVDLQENTFQLLGFTDKETFASTSVSFRNFELAYDSIDQIDHQAVCNRIYLYKYKESGEYDFDLTLVQETLEEYLYSKNTSTRFRMVSMPWNHCAYGFETYQCLQDYYQHLLEGKTHFDVRHVHTLWEHKRLMVSRIKYMQENTSYLNSSHQIYEGYSEIERKARNTRNLMLKFYMQQEEETLHKIMRYLDEIAAQEAMVMEKLLTLLRRHETKLL
ncbi:hypothetical protein [Brevibacillus formosus]|uniref:hypothetical protein n=1 Tax=Brevibacillus formosus TaxID=54913 RepID=UPI001F3404EE|nr:hypothetical protein [Brevibacillus formosus]